MITTFSLTIINQNNYQQKAELFSGGRRIIELNMIYLISNRTTKK
jgi:hypothetical protein